MDRTEDEDSSTSASTPYEERDDDDHSEHSNESYHATVERAPAKTAAPDAVTQQNAGDFENHDQRVRIKGHLNREMMDSCMGQVYYCAAPGWQPCFDGPFSDSKFVVTYHNQNDEFLMDEQTYACIGHNTTVDDLREKMSKGPVPLKLHKKHEKEPIMLYTQVRSLKGARPSRFFNIGSPFCWRASRYRGQATAQRTSAFGDCVRRQGFQNRDPLQKLLRMTVPEFESWHTADRLELVATASGDTLTLLNREWQYRRRHNRTGVCLGSPEPEKSTPLSTRPCWARPPSGRTAPR